MYASGLSNLTGSDTRILHHFVPPEGPGQLPACGPALRKMAKPGDLPLGVLPRAGLHENNRLRARLLAIEEGEDLLVTERLCRLAARRMRRAPQCLRLVDQPGGEHRFD